MRDVTVDPDHASPTSRASASVDVTDGQDPPAVGGQVAADGVRRGWLPTLTVEPAPSGPRYGLWAGSLSAIVLLVVLGSAMATRLPAGTTLAGAEIGSAAEAPAALLDAQHALAALEFSFVTEVGTRTTRSGADLGLTIDADASRAPVRNGMPSILAWARRPMGAEDNPMVLRAIPPDRLTSVAQQVSADPVDADVEVRLTDIDITPGQDGIQSSAGDVDGGLASALTRIAVSPPDDWPAVLDVEVGGTVLPPAVTQEDIDALAETLERFDTAAVTLTAEVAAEPEGDSGGSAVSDDREQASIRLTRSDLRRLVRVESVPDAPAGQRLQLIPDTANPSVRVTEMLEAARIAPVVTARIENRSPTPSQGEDLADVSSITGDIVPGETLSLGFEPDWEATLSDVIAAGLAGEGTVEVTGAPLAAPTPEDMGIVEPISTFTTFFPAGQSRVQNIHRIADIVDGTIIPAGETYELNHAVGRRTREAGFTLGGAILDGELVSDVGGGVSQFATTFFNAAWFAGVELVDWKAHSFYFPRYPAGREATINYPNVNLEIRNDTPHAILVDTDYTPSSVTVSFWSTRHWDVQTVTGPCACGGSFSITVDRIRTAPDGERLEESWTTFYTVPR